MTHFLGIVAYLLRVESARACGGSEMGPADAAPEGGAMEAIGTAALTEEIPQLKQRLFHFMHFLCMQVGQTDS